MIFQRQTSAKAFAKYVFINLERKLEVRRRLDTALFSVARVRPRTSKGITDLLLLYLVLFTIANPISFCNRDR